MLTHTGLDTSDRTSHPSRQGPTFAAEPHLSHGYHGRLSPMVPSTAAGSSTETLRATVAARSTDSNPASLSEGPGTPWPSAETFAQNEQDSVASAAQHPPSFAQIATAAPQHQLGQRMRQMRPALAPSLMVSIFVRVRVDDNIVRFLVAESYVAVLSLDPGRWLFGWSTGCTLSSRIPSAPAKFHVVWLGSDCYLRRPFYGLASIPCHRTLVSALFFPYRTATPFEPSIPATVSEELTQ